MEKLSLGRKSNCQSFSPRRIPTRTDLGKTQNEKPSGQEDHFHRLPEELFVSILTILADLKSLCKCSLVSKHFASAVSRVRTVCVTIPCNGPHSEEYLRSRTMPPKPKQLVFLEKFRELESIYLEYKYPENSSSSSFVKWKVKFSTNFPNIERLVALSAPSVHNLTAGDHFQVQNSTESVLAECYMSSFACFVKWMCIISMLGKSHTSLKRVTVTDSEKRGKLVIGDEQLVRIRKCVRRPQKMYQFRQGLEAAHVRLLYFQLSSYVMRWVRLLMFDNPTESCASAKDDIEYWDFEDEEKVLVEAINAVYKNRVDRVDIRKVSIS